MNKVMFLIFIYSLLPGMAMAEGIPACYQEVDQVIWVVSNLDQTVNQYEQLGFFQFTDLGEVMIKSEFAKSSENARLVVANLGGAVVMDSAAW